MEDRESLLREIDASLQPMVARAREEQTELRKIEETHGKTFDLFKSSVRRVSDQVAETEAKRAEALERTKRCLSACAREQRRPKQRKARKGLSLQERMPSGLSREEFHKLTTFDAECSVERLEKAIKAIKARLDEKEKLAMTAIEHTEVP